MNAFKSTCLVCGIVDPGGVGMRLSHWLEPGDADEYSVIPRCIDTHPCQARCIANGEDWPLVPSHDTDPLLIKVPRAQPEPPPAEPVRADPWASFLEAAP